MKGTVYLIVTALLVFWTMEMCVLGETMLVEGTESWRIVLTPSYGTFNDPGALKSYRNESNSQVVVEATPQRIVIDRALNLEPFRSDFPMARVGEYRKKNDIKRYIHDSHSDEIKKIAGELLKGAVTQSEYVDRVIFEVRDRLVWRYTNFTDADDALRQGYSTCAGFANLTVSLLNASGVPARYVSVQTLRHPSWNAGAHAEVEVYYADKGWVSYDPQKHLHHAPFPRVYLGNSGTVSVSSREPDLFRAYSFFSRNSYYVTYTKTSSTARFSGMIREPSKQEMVGRSDGHGTTVPSITGRIYDGNGKVFNTDWVYYNLNPAGNTSYTGTPIVNGSYMIRNGPKGAKLFYDEGGYVISYTFPPAADNKTLVHDIRFDETDSILYTTQYSNSQVRLYSDTNENSYNIFRSGSSGLVRLHVNEAKKGRIVNEKRFMYREGKWQEALPGKAEGKK